MLLPPAAGHEREVGVVQDVGAGVAARVCGGKGRQELEAVDAALLEGSPERARPGQLGPSNLAPTGLSFELLIAGRRGSNACLRGIWEACYSITFLPERLPLEPPGPPAQRLVDRFGMNTNNLAEAQIDPIANILGDGTMGVVHDFFRLDHCLWWLAEHASFRSQPTAAERERFRKACATFYAGLVKLSPEGLYVFREIGTDKKPHDSLVIDRACLKRTCRGKPCHHSLAAAFLLHNGDGRSMVDESPSPPTLPPSTPPSTAASAPRTPPRKRQQTRVPIRREARAVERPSLLGPKIDALARFQERSWPLALEAGLTGSRRRRRARGGRRGHAIADPPCPRRRAEPSQAPFRALQCRRAD
ncbi:hypothetical protein DFJ74DRAFT_295891 [Hyaloraphidium curvatum]|nr:hypothetical protein DFJ74DRAFT_295891 [Hyaloraphidium curvatum]